jgi:hypothetical protein
MEHSDNKQITTFNAEVENVGEAARKDASFDPSLVFRKGEYFIDEEQVPVGSEYLAHPEAGVKVWRKYDGERLVEHLVYNVAKGEKPPEREDLDDWPQNENWPTDDSGEAYDPWALVYLLPFEKVEMGEMIIFSTRSMGGRRSVADLARAWTQRCKRVTNCGLPIIKLAVTTFYSKKAKGDVKRSLFTIVGWDDRNPPTSGGAEVLPPNKSGGDEMNDKIPF